MPYPTMRIIAACAVLLFLPTGCAGVSRPLETTGETPSAGALLVKELAKTSRSWDGTLLPKYPEGLPEITVLRISIPAGARLHTHRHPVINAGVLTSGQLTVVTAEGKTLHLKAGDSIVEVVNTAHHGINEGAIPAEIIVFYAGTVNTPITVIEPH